MNIELMERANTYRPAKAQDWIDYKTSKRTLDVLIEHSDIMGETFVAIHTIAERLLCSNQTVMNHLEKLKKIGVLEIEKVGRFHVKKISFDCSSDCSNDCSKETYKIDSSEASNISSSEASNVSSSVSSSGLGANIIEGIEGSVTKSKDKSSDAFSEEVKFVAKHLHDKIMETYPNHRKMTIESWYGDIEKAIRIDKREVDALIAMIDWIHTPDGSFWSPNIQSGKKLRDKYDQVEAQYIKKEAEKAKRRMAS